jgi:hypothetical protein
MPIERKKSSYAHDDVVEPEIETEEVAEAASEPEGDTATISLSILGGQSVSPGDTVRLEVVESSADDGTVTLRYRKPDSKKGVDKAASEFEQLDQPMKGMV